MGGGKGMQREREREREGAREGGIEGGSEGVAGEGSGGCGGRGAVGRGGIDAWDSSSGFRAVERTFSQRFRGGARRRPPCPARSGGAGSLGRERKRRQSKPRVFRAAFVSKTARFPRGFRGGARVRRRRCTGTAVKIYCSTRAPRFDAPTCPPALSGESRAGRDRLGGAGGGGGGGGGVCMCVCVGGHPVDSAWRIHVRCGCGARVCPVCRALFCIGESVHVRFSGGWGLGGGGGGRSFPATARRRRTEIFVYRIFC